jgi:UDP-N-acetylglucosamine 2-epimerase (non-hydrolysing)
VKVLLAAGTRPEVIKLAPVLKALKKKSGVDARLCVTGQHRELLREALRAFGLRPHVDLRLMRPGQTPAQVLERGRAALAPVLARERPDIVVVQGDTTSALAAALAARAAGIPVAHVEAGLRSHDLRHPWPEEGNRMRIDAVSQLWFAPTETARKNLLKEGRGPAWLSVTGNTAVDALRWALRRARPPGNLPKQKLVVVTLHRRESFGKPLKGLMSAIASAAKARPEWTWVLPVHPNPAVRRAAKALANLPTVRLVAPLGYLEFVGLMKRAEFLVTDSGGIQEEAPTLKKAVLVVRRRTERGELIGRGGKLIGNSGSRLKMELLKWTAGKRPAAPKRNPFGDGRAGERIAAILLRYHKAK